jgi:NAD(P)-dependent dehydrogenase (short-subunit alcohol dehydrogenase family)
MDLKLIDKTALVTGSTAGIGLEIARTLAVRRRQGVRHRP